MSKSAVVAISFLVAAPVFALVIAASLDARDAHRMKARAISAETKIAHVCSSLRTQLEAAEQRVATDPDRAAAMLIDASPYFQACMPDREASALVQRAVLASASDNAEAVATVVHDAIDMLAEDHR